MVFNVEYTETHWGSNGNGLCISMEKKRTIETVNGQRLKDIIFNKTQSLLYSETSNRFKASQYIEFEKFLDELIDGLECGCSEEWHVRDITFKVERIR